MVDMRLDALNSRSLTEKKRNGSYIIRESVKFVWLSEAIFYFFLQNFAKTLCKDRIKIYKNIY